MAVMPGHSVETLLAVGAEAHLESGCAFVGGSWIGVRVGVGVEVGVVHGRVDWVAAGSEAEAERRLLSLVDGVAVAVAVAASCGGGG